SHQGVDGDTRGSTATPWGGVRDGALAGDCAGQPLPREVSMKERFQGPRAKWIRIGLVVAALIASHALHDGSAEAATTPPQTIVLAGFTSQRLPAFFK